MTVYDIIRLFVLVAASGAALVALGSWAVTTRRIHPTTGVARLIRRLTDPVLDPIERWLLTTGRNPQDAPWWLLGIAVIGGIVLLTVAQWLVGVAVRVMGAGRSGPRATLRVVLYLAGQVVLFSLIARVIGSWFGAGRFSRWLRPAYRLTDWIVEPLRRFIPPLGVIDITPLVAWILLQFVLGLLLRAI